MPLSLKVVSSLGHAFDPARTPSVLRRYETETNWKPPPLAVKYPRFSTDRDIAEANNLEWITPGHPLFEALHSHARALDTDTSGPLRDIHRRVGAAILFESSGGQTDKVAHLPELRFAIGEPEVEVGIDSRLHDKRTFT